MQRNTKLNSMGRIISNYYHRTNTKYEEQEDGCQESLLSANTDRHAVRWDCTHWSGRFKDFRIGTLANIVIFILSATMLVASYRPLRQDLNVHVKETSYFCEALYPKLNLYQILTF